MVSHFPFFVLVPASLQVNTLAELVAYVKARPGQVSYASNGSGLISHLGMEMLKQSTGMDLLHVPYKGFAPALPDLLSGRVAVMMADLAPVGQQLRAGIAARAGRDLGAALRLPARGAHGRRTRQPGLRDRRLVRPVRAGEDAGRHRRAG